jgi:hypothetical protein
MTSLRRHAGVVDLRPYVERLRHDLVHVAAAAGADVAAAAERVVVALESSVRLVLLDALEAAAAEVSAGLDGPVVEVRLRAGEPELVVVTPDWAPPSGPPSGPPSEDPPRRPDDVELDELDELDDAIARLTVRLSERLKSSAEAAASATGRSLNSWIADAVRSAVAAPDEEPSPGRRRGGSGRRRVQGWAR